MDTRFDEAMPVECAIARAGKEIMLCLESREGRLPLSETFTDGKKLAWQCADGTIEIPYLSGDTASVDMADLVSEFQGGALLVNEFSGEEDQAPANWLMTPKG